jgi:hypothetical protein
MRKVAFLLTALSSFLGFLMHHISTVDWTVAPCNGFKCEAFRFISIHMNFTQLLFPTERILPGRRDSLSNGLQMICQIDIPGYQQNLLGLAWGTNSIGVHQTLSLLFTLANKCLNDKFVNNKI